MKREIVSQIHKLGITGYTFTELKAKDNIYIYRLNCDNKTYILKYLGSPNSQEVANYRLLSSMGLKVLKVIEHTDSSLLLEDIEDSQALRLGTKEDLNDIEIAKQLAEWYKLLHEKGNKFLESSKAQFYSQLDVITLANLKFIESKSKTTGSQFWTLLFPNLINILDYIKKIPKTITYNDFNWSNIAVAKDNTTAFMFDYNNLGKGYAYADIRNVCSNLSPQAAKAFINSYGMFNPDEKIVDDVIYHLINLHYAYKSSAFPAQANESLNMLTSGNLATSLNNLLNFIS